MKSYGYEKALDKPIRELGTKPEGNKPCRLATPHRHPKKQKNCRKAFAGMITFL